MFKKLIIILLFISINLNNTISANNIVLIKDIETEDFIKQLMQPIFNVAGVDSKSINIYIVNNPTPNAFVYNGQNIFIHTGLISFADTHSEIAGVLAHELAHITLGHLARGQDAYNKANLFALIGIGSTILATLLLAGSNTDIAQNSGSIIAFLGAGSQNVALNKVLAYSKAEESQADQMAYQYLQQTPYGTKGLLTFMQKLLQLEDANNKNNIFAWYTTHPSTNTRVSFFNNNIVMPSTNYINTNLQNKFLNIKAKIQAYSSPTTALSIYQNNNANYALYGTAIAYYLQSNYNKALQILTALPQSNYVNEIIADIYYQQNNFTQAIAYYKKLINVNTNKDLIYLSIAKSYYALKNNAQAKTNIDIAISSNSNNPSAWHLKALIEGQLNNNAVANLALAEHNFLLQNYPTAIKFANAALLDFTVNSNNYNQARLLIKQAQNNLKK